MKFAVCPYCGEENTPRNVIDEEGGLGKKVRKIYLCPECNEIFKGRGSRHEIQLPVDVFFKRKDRYSRRNLACLM